MTVEQYAKNDTFLPGCRKDVITSEQQSKIGLDCYHDSPTAKSACMDGSSEFVRLATFGNFIANDVKNDIKDSGYKMSPELAMGLFKQVCVTQGYGKKFLNESAVAMLCAVHMNDIQKSSFNNLNEQKVSNDVYRRLGNNVYECHDNIELCLMFVAAAGQLLGYGGNDNCPKFNKWVSCCHNLAIQHRQDAITYL